MIIDFHTHIFPPDVRENRELYCHSDATFAEMYSDPKAKVATAEDLLASMDDAGVDVSVALGFAWQDPETCTRHNEYLFEAASSSGGRIIPFATVNMSDGCAELEIERCAAAGARGLGELRPFNQGWDVAGHEGVRLALAAQRHSLALLFHVTDPGDRDYPGRRGFEMADFAAFVLEYPDTVTVGAHLGGGVYDGRLGSTAYVDTAAQPFLYPGEAAVPVLAGVPMDRLLFGSDFPLISQQRQIAELTKVITDPNRMEAALGGNARKLLEP